MDPLEEAGRLNETFEQTGSLDALDRAIHIVGSSSNQLPDGSPERPRYLGALGSMLRSRFRASHDPSDLERSLEALTAAFAEAQRRSRAPADYAPYLDDAMTTRSTIYLVTGDRMQLDTAINGRETLLMQVRGHPPLRRRILRNLATDYKHRFDREHDPDDLERCGIRLGEALELTSDDDPVRVDLLLSMADVVSERHRLNGAIDDLEAAVKLRSDALRRVPETFAEYVEQELTLGGELFALYRATGDDALFEQAIGLWDSAARSPQLAPGAGPRLFNNIAALILERYGRTHDVADLDDAIGSLDEALTALGAAGATREREDDRSRFEASLAGLLRQRHDRTHDPADLARAEQLERGA